MPNIWTKLSSIVGDRKTWLKKIGRLRKTVNRPIGNKYLYFIQQWHWYKGVKYNQESI